MKANAVDTLDTAEQTPTRVRYQVLAMVCGLSMITYLDRVCFGAAAPDITRELSLKSVADLKGAFTAFAIAYAVFEIPTGWLGDRWGPRGVLMRIVIWWSVCTALTGLVGLKVAGVTLGGLGTLVVLRFLFGIGEAGAYPNITRALHNWFPSEQWEFAQGMVWMTGRLMGGLTPLLWAVLVSTTQYTTPLMNWRGAFVLFGVLGLVWCGVFAVWFRSRPTDDARVNAAERAMISGQSADENATIEAATAHHHGGVPWAAMLRSRSLWAICSMYFLITYVWIFNITYLPSYLKDRFAVGDGELLGAIYKGAPLWLGAAGCLAGGFLVTALAKRLGDRRRARCALGVTAMLMCALFWCGALVASNLHVFCLLVSLSAFCIDLTVGAAWATCQDLGQKHAAVTAATMNTVGTFGAAAAGWLTGTFLEMSLASQAASQQVSVEALSVADKLAALLAGYDVLFVSNIGAFLIAAVCWLLIDARRPLAA